MKIRIIVPGRTRMAGADEMIETWLRRTRAWVPVEWVEVAAAKEGSPEARRRREGAEMLSRLPSVGYTVALDERGKLLKSREFARLIDERMLEGRDLSLLVGGSEGLSREVRDRVDMLWSLSPLTMPHDLARLVVAEQVYRALAILKNHPYPR